MAKKCLNQEPTIRVSLHIPPTSWRPHTDQTFNRKAPTEWEAWAKTMLTLLSTFTQGNPRLMVGYWLDALNVLPSDLRLALITGIVHGYGLNIRDVPGESHTIEVSLAQRYPPLSGPQVSASGLVVPKQGPAELVLPGDVRFR